MPVTLFVGDCTEYLSTQAKSFDASAYLIDYSNYKNFLQETDADLTAYTSAADCPKITKNECVFYKVLQKADQIYYCPPKVWSDHIDDFSLQCMAQLTEYFLYLLQSEKNNVQGLDLSKYKKNPYLRLQNNRNAILGPQLWVAGCSITAGVGVDTKEKFPVLVAENFGGQFVDLAVGGSSLEFAADQIIRSDVRQGDFVLWGLTSEYRASIWNRKLQRCGSLVPETFNYKATNQADDIVDETRLYKAVVVFTQVENFCQKIGAHLIAIPIICSEALQLLLHDHTGYYQLPYQVQYLDRGSDNLHPGPLQHQWYAEQIKTWTPLP